MQIIETLGGTYAARATLNGAAPTKRPAKREEVLQPSAANSLSTWYCAEDGNQFGFYPDGRIMVRFFDGTGILIKDTQVTIEKEGRNIRHLPAQVIELHAEAMKLAVYPSRAQLSIVRRAGQIVINSLLGCFALEVQQDGRLNYRR